MKKLTLTTAAALAIFFGAGAAHAGSCGSSSSDTKAKQASYSDEAAKMNDIVATAMAADNFSTLVTAVKTAGLVETLQGEGPFTVFAPTDEAFAALGEETIKAVLADKEKLTAILTYHVVPGAQMASDVIASSKWETVNGQSATVVATDEGVMIDNANIIATDILCSNGVIHVIDAVILPKAGK